VIAALVFVVLTTWQRGREIVTERRTELEGPLRDFIEEIRDPDQPITRSPRTGIFLDANPETTPLALRANVEHNCVLHESVVIVSVQTLNVPHVAEDERVSVDDLGYRDDRITHLTARFGFQDDLDVPRTLRHAAERMEREADFDHVSYFLSRISIVPGKEPGMSRWRKRLFIAIARNAASPVPYFHLPDEQTIVMASHVEL
jgi:KUP system potassium uptake protein